MKRSRRLLANLELIILMLVQALTSIGPTRLESTPRDAINLTSATKPFDLRPHHSQDGRLRATQLGPISMANLIKRIHAAPNGQHIWGYPISNDHQRQSAFSKFKQTEMDKLIRLIADYFDQFIPIDLLDYHHQQIEPAANTSSNDLRLLKRVHRTKRGLVTDGADGSGGEYDLVNITNGTTSGNGTDMSSSVGPTHMKLVAAQNEIKSGHKRKPNEAKARFKRKSAGSRTKAARKQPEPPQPTTTTEDGLSGSSEINSPIEVENDDQQTTTTSAPHYSNQVIGLDSANAVVGHSAALTQEDQPQSSRQISKHLTSKTGLDETHESELAPQTFSNKLNGDPSSLNQIDTIRQSQRQTISDASSKQQDLDLLRMFLNLTTAPNNVDQVATSPIGPRDDDRPSRMFTTATIPRRLISANDFYTTNQQRLTSNNLMGLIDSEPNNAPQPTKKQKNLRVSGSRRFTNFASIGSPSLDLIQSRPDSDYGNQQMDQLNHLQQNPASQQGAHLTGNANQVLNYFKGLSPISSLGQHQTHTTTTALPLIYNQQYSANLAAPMSNNQQTTAHPFNLQRHGVNNIQQAYVVAKQATMPLHLPFGSTSRFGMAYSKAPSPSKRLMTASGSNSHRTVKQAYDEPGTQASSNLQMGSPASNDPLWSDTQNQEDDYQQAPQTIQITAVPNGGLVGNGFNGFNNFNGWNGGAWGGPWNGRQVLLVNRQPQVGSEWRQWALPIAIILALPLILGALFVPVFLKSVMFLIQILQMLGLLMPPHQLAGHLAGSHSSSSSG